MRLGTGLILVLWTGCSAEPAPPSTPASVRAETMDGRSYTLTGPDALLHSIITNDVKTGAAVLEAGVDLRKPYDSKTGWHFLHLAAQVGRLEIAKLLVQHGAPLNARNSGGKTALAVARANEHPELVEYLVGLGATD